MRWPEVIFGLQRSQITEEATVSLEDFIITVYCLVEEILDELVGCQRLREKGH